MKRIVSLLALVCFTASGSGCITLKLTDSKPGSRPFAAICEKRTAVFVLDDKRTVTKLDRQLAESPAVAISRAVSDKFHEYCPDTVKFIGHQAGSTEVKHYNTLTASDNFDFLLTGSIDRFQSEYEDKYFGLRMAGSLIAGMTIPVGLLLLPVISAGYVDHVTDVDFTLSLVEVSSGMIVWSKRSEFRELENVAFVEATGARIEEKLNSHLESATSAMFAHISSAYKRRQNSSLALGQLPDGRPSALTATFSH